MELKSDIFKELKRLKFKEGAAWVVNMYNKFYPYLSYTVKLDLFLSTMNELCEEGYFNTRDDGYDSPTFVLTEQGERYLNNLI